MQQVQDGSVLTVSRHKEGVPMATATVESRFAQPGPTLRERVVDTARKVARMSQDARTLKVAAADAVEDGMYKARRAAKTAKRGFYDTRDEAVYRIKQEPLKAVGVAFGAGLLVGVASGAVAWFAARAVRRTRA